ncbi:hypothetical protein PR003_g26141 [Phytophthora rubi]|uniref:Uncharacterized protein n=2 Tax=Phytophthora TaxID=4783 RepID=A0A6A4C9H9_9STRA|nr:hypothetical protein PR001_g24506 [Phytophthora rubi]KAE9287070.1 hypothetical protein PR003_g26141 [Phytophthora rubi]KAE9294366.1 hypothetical protein PF008_g24568 [Phytophthora fragariae]
MVVLSTTAVIARSLTYVLITLWCASTGFCGHFTRRSCSDVPPCLWLCEVSFCEPVSEPGLAVLLPLEQRTAQVIGPSAFGPH